MEENSSADATISRLHIAYGVEERRGSPAILGEKLGVEPNVISGWRTRGVPPDKIARATIDTGYIELWLRTGKGPMRVQFDGRRVRDEAVPGEGDCCMEVEIYNRVAGDPNGTEGEWPEPIDRRRIPVGLLRPNIRVVKLEGRSMEPTLRDGAMIGIDTSDRRVVDGEAFAVVLPYSGAAVKRLYLLPTGIILRSDNREFPDVTLPRNDIPEHFIVGRVRWVIQEM